MPSTFRSRRPTSLPWSFQSFGVRPRPTPWDSVRHDAYTFRFASAVFDIVDRPRPLVAAAVREAQPRHGAAQLSQRVVIVVIAAVVARVDAEPVGIGPGLLGQIRKPTVLGETWLRSGAMVRSSLLKPE